MISLLFEFGQIFFSFSVTQYFAREQEYGVYRL